MNLTEYLTQVRARVDTATPGPWSIGTYNEENPDLYDEGFPTVFSIDAPTQDRIVETDAGHYGPQWHDAQLIASAPSDLRKLLAIVEAQRKALEEIARDQCSKSEWLIERMAANESRAQAALAEADRIAWES